MALARYPYRFVLLLVGCAVAGGFDDLGAYHSEGIALPGLGIGGLALLAGAVAHYPSVRTVAGRTVVAAPTASTTPATRECGSGTRTGA